MPIDFVITPETDTELTSITDGDLVTVELSIAGGQLIASELEASNEEAEEQEFEVQGVILAANTSACPDASFTVEDEDSGQQVKVVADANTVYRNGSCTDLIPGAVVDARGEVINGVNLAQRVTFEE